MRLTATLLFAALFLAPAGVASGASAPPTGWDGTNPFTCVLQNAGFGTVVPDPAADPYCVDFDKRHQSVADGGVVQFLSLEPARVAATNDKCFYFQSDHWRGSVVQDDGSTKTYEWDGHYFYDKARAEGGVWVTNFSLNGKTQDPSRLPGMPQEYARYVGPGTGGMITRNQVEGDPACAARATKEPEKIYPGTPGKPGGAPACMAAAGTVGTGRLGPVAIGQSEVSVRGALGDPARVQRGFLRYCIQGAGKYMVGIDRDRSGNGGRRPGADDARAVIVLTSNRAFAYEGVARGASEAAVRKAFPRLRRLVTVGGTRVLATSKGSAVVVGIADGSVRFLAVYDRTALDPRALGAYVRRSA
jgi:hypothetical protein